MVWCRWHQAVYFSILMADNLHSWSTVALSVVWDILVQSVRVYIMWSLKCDFLCSFSVTRVRLFFTSSPVFRREFTLIKSNYNATGRFVMPIKLSGQAHFIRLTSAQLIPRPCRCCSFGFTTLKGMPKMLNIVKVKPQLPPLLLNQVLIPLA